ncbi:hypothetical protein O7623_15890 [Solwaraspora sp. WMMD791]|uniref:hypothetical protein n=1 Tax=Solwaraspora sp. WMMD791 TaxID=3016086 RepID=UPI00249B8F1C|nr:hypothetical protein [Solwaraspora sp. WMMD791]WFE24915.1 hypothetical protein O7623_15890 [Solwaraspora sp. WMMD791]
MVAPPIAVGVLLLGLLFKTATTTYVVTHLRAVDDGVSPEDAANRNGLEDLALDVVARLELTMSGLAIAGLLLSITGLVRGSGWAHVTTCALASPFALFCGILLVDGRGSAVADIDDLGHVAPRFEIVPTWVSVCDTLGPPLLVAGAIAVLVLLFLPPVFRRFYPRPTNSPAPGVELLSVNRSPQSPRSM